MNNLSDEILNKFIDNELDQATLKTVREQLKNSEADRRRLKALQLIHSKLAVIQPGSVSSDFTSVLMKKIAKKSRAKKEQKIFILSISSVFVLIALGILGYVLTIILSAPVSPDATVTGAKETVSFIQNIIGPVQNFFSGINLSVIGSVFSLGLLISVYFVLDLMKHTKRTLSRQH